MEFGFVITMSIVPQHKDEYIHLLMRMLRTPT